MNKNLPSGIAVLAVAGFGALIYTSYSKPEAAPATNEAPTGRANVEVVRNGVRAHHWKFGSMPPVDGITDAEDGTIVAYVRALQRANGIN